MAVEDFIDNRLQIYIMSKTPLLCSEVNYNEPDSVKIDLLFLSCSISYGWNILMTQTHIPFQMRFLTHYINL